MAPHLRPEVIAAIETAVDLNDGQLESAFIHSLAKIYKTSPQAVVWNMKRFNKVKAGADDRKKTGRRAAMDKDQAAEHTREILAQNPSMKYDQIVEALFEKFEIRVSTTWVSRLLKNYEIAHEKPPPTTPRREPKKRIRLESPVLEGPITQDGTNPLRISSPPHPINYPSFRQDLQQALGSSLANPTYVAPHLPPYQSQLPPSHPLVSQPPPSPPVSVSRSHVKPAAERRTIQTVAEAHPPPAPGLGSSYSTLFIPTNASTAPTIATAGVRKPAAAPREFVFKVVNMVEPP